MRFDPSAALTKAAGGIKESRVDAVDFRTTEGLNREIPDGAFMAAPKA